MLDDAGLGTWSGLFLMDPQHVLRMAQQAYQPAQLAEAKLACEQLLKEDSDSAVAHQGLGLILLRQDQASEASTHFERALQQNPRNAQLWSQLGSARFHANQMEEARQALTHSLQLNPKQAESHYYLGLSWLNSGQTQQAESHFEEYVSLHPHAAEGWYQLACLNPDPDTARSLLERAIRLRPGFQAAQLQLGLILIELDDLQNAQHVFQQATQGPQPAAEAYYHLSYLSALAGKYSAAIQQCRAALTLNPDFHQSRFQLAWLLSLVNQDDEAAAIYLDLLSREIEPVKAQISLGQMAERKRRMTEARTHYLQALEREPGPLSWYAWANFLQASGETEQAAEAYAQALQVTAPGIKANQVAAARIMSLYCAPAVSDLKLLEEIQSAVPLAQTPLFSDAARAGKLRWGYVSPDCFQHAAGLLLRTLLMHHDSDTIDFHVFALPGRDDPMTSELKSLAGHWHWLDAEDMEANARLIARQQIDILIDLAGFSSRSLLSLFAYRPAPVQITGLGLPLPTGMPAFTAFVSDRICAQSGVPALAPQALTHAEAPLLLPSWICWQKPDGALPLRQEPAHSVFVFGSPHGLPKLNSQLLSVWAEILKRCPDSQLLIKAAGVDDALIQEHLLAAFGEIDPARVRLEALSGYREYLDFYNKVDCILDSFPYPGGTTSCESLWMGVPVLTLPGRHGGGVSLLQQTGCPEWIAQNLQEYQALAVQLAAAGPRSLAERQALRQKFEQTPACQPAQIVQALEAAGIALREDAARLNIGL